MRNGKFMVHGYNNITLFECEESVKILVQTYLNEKKM